MVCFKDINVYALLTNFFNCLIFIRMVDNYMTLVFYHLRYFEKQPVLHYIGSEEDVWDYINWQILSCFELTYKDT